MDDHGAFRVISDIELELCTLKDISQLVNAVRIAMEKGDDEPDSLIPALFAIHRYIDIFADQLSAECRTYFEAVRTAKAEKKMNSNMTDEEFMKALREHPELIPQVMQILTQGKQEVHPAG